MRCVLSTSMRKTCGRAIGRRRAPAARSRPLAARGASGAGARRAAEERAGGERGRVGDDRVRAELADVLEGQAAEDADEGAEEDERRREHRVPPRARQVLAAAAAAAPGPVELRGGLDVAAERVLEVVRVALEVRGRARREEGEQPAVRRDDAERRRRDRFVERERGARPDAHGAAEGHVGAVALEERPSLRRDALEGRDRAVGDAHGDELHAGVGVGAIDLLGEPGVVRAGLEREDTGPALVGARESQGGGEEELLHAAASTFIGPSPGNRRPPGHSFTACKRRP